MVLFPNLFLMEVFFTYFLSCYVYYYHYFLVLWCCSTTCNKKNWLSCREYLFLRTLFLCEFLVSLVWTRIIFKEHLRSSLSLNDLDCLIMGSRRTGLATLENSWASFTVLLWIVPWVSHKEHVADWTVELSLRALRSGFRATEVVTPREVQSHATKYSEAIAQHLRWMRLLDRWEMTWFSLCVTSIQGKRDVTVEILKTILKSKPKLKKG